MGWAFTIDDYLDKNEGEFENWIKIIESKKSVNNTPLDLMWEEIWNEFIPLFTAEQKIKFSLSTISWFSSYENVGAIKLGKRKLSGEELIEFCLNYVLKEVNFIWPSVRLICVWTMCTTWIG